MRKVTGLGFAMNVGFHALKSVLHSISKRGQECQFSSSLRCAGKFDKKLSGEFAVATMVLSGELQLR